MPKESKKKKIKVIKGNKNINDAKDKKNGKNKKNNKTTGVKNNVSKSGKKTEKLTTGGKADKKKSKASVESSKKTKMKKVKCGDEGFEESYFSDDEECCSTDIDDACEFQDGSWDKVGDAGVGNYENLDLDYQDDLKDKDSFYYNADNDNLGSADYVIDLFTKDKDERNVFTVNNEFKGAHVDRTSCKTSVSDYGYEYPDLLSLQFKSFYKLFPFGVNSEGRRRDVLYNLIKKYFPVKSIKNEYILDFVDYNVEPPKYTPEECIKNGISYAVSLVVKFRLISKDNVLEQDVYLGDIPYMTESASFIYNGIERVGVMQIGKSTGISFICNKKNGFSASSCVCKIIPLVGAWIEFTINQKMQMFVTFNKKAKVYVTTFLRAVGFKTNYDILRIFGLVDLVNCSDRKELEKYKGRKLACKIFKDTNDRKKSSSKDVLISHYTVITDVVIDKILSYGVQSILVLKNDKKLIEKYAILIDTLNIDPIEDEDQAFLKIYNSYLNTEYVSDLTTVKNFFHNLVQNEKTFDLGYVGRKKLDSISGKKSGKNWKILSKGDISAILSYFFDVIHREKDIVDIDHYGNKQLKTVGEKLFETLDSCLKKISRVAKERINVCDRGDMNIYNLINCSILSVSVNSFFATSSLLQFMDEINPLCSLMHKRRISACGEGGIDENNASAEMRDIHYSQYGRVCPVETPESSTIGIISSLSMPVKTDPYGFMLTPYRPVKDGVVNLDNNAIVYLNADDELGKNIIPAGTPFDSNGVLLNEFIKARISDNFKLVRKNEVDYIEVISNEPFSAAASTIPFLENDDSSRALTGTNMLKQAVPLLVPEAPIVGTGVEHKICQDSRKVLYAEGNGVVKYVDANKIVVEYDVDKGEELYTYDKKVKQYNILKFRGTNQKTCENYRPVVKLGQKLKKGDVLTDGFSTDKGELALGKNIVVAFMTCYGYNFQDAIVISEKLLKDDVFTSICVDKFTVYTKNTKFGDEKITRDVNSLTEDKKRFLDENGLVKKGTYVKHGDVLVGKVKPKVENYNTPENRLLRAIFGDNSCEMVNCSLTVPPFTDGIVVNTRVFSRREVKKNSSVIKRELEDLKAKYNKILSEFIDVALGKFLKVLSGKKANNIIHRYGEIMIKEGTEFTKDVLMSTVLSTTIAPDSIKTVYNDLSYFKILGDILCSNWTDDENINEIVIKLINNTLKKQNDILNAYYKDEYYLLHGDYLQDEVLKKAEVTIANKRKLRIGDKLSGRHGNKGVISKILKEEDMPFLEDGTRVDIILTPLGIPSRMNIGQIYETLLGLAGKKLGCMYKSPIFNGYNIDSINEELKKAGLPNCCEMQLYDGLTGEKFDQKCTVGVIYMIKLNHMVVDKVHARSIGQYSVITQQPLSGRAHFGGQRFGEMEVWSLEAYGAANLLQEMLTIKSDDIRGRKIAYESLLAGEPIFNSDVPESFHVLMKELTAIGLRLTFVN